MAFEGNITVGGRTISSFGGQDILLSKFSPDGDTIWNKRIGSNGDDGPRRLYFAENNEIYITGGFEGICYFDDIILSNTYSSEDIYLAKYSSDGGVLWAKNIAWGPNQERSSGIIADNDRNLALVGFFRDSIFFENDTLISSGGIDNFYAKFDEDGNFIKAIHYPGTNNSTRLNEISLSNDNALLISGFYSGTLSAQTETLVSSGSSDVVLIKINTDDSEIWIRTAGSTLDDRGYNTSSDQYGNVYLTGYVSGAPLFDSTAYGLRDSSPLNTKGGNDMFIAKYNKNGTLQWKRCNGDEYADQGQGVFVYNNIVQFTGFFTGTVIFGIDTLLSKNNSQDAGFFVYNTDGTSIKGVSVQGSLEDKGADVVYDNAGASYLAGDFLSDTLYLSDQTIIKTAVGFKNPFLAKYAIPFSASFTDIKEINCNGDADAELTVTPYFGIGPYIFSWSHDAGLEDSTATGLSAGVYSVTITDSRDSTAFATIDLTDPEPITIVPAITDVSCHPANGTANDGGINISVDGGTVKGLYSYVWEAISGSGINPTTEDQPNLSAGEYCVTITDDNLCVEDDTFYVTQPDEILFSGSAVTHEIEIPPGSNGEVDLSVSGGTSGYNYNWAGPGGYSSGSEDLTGLSLGGSYTIQITDASSCHADTTFLVTSDTMFIAYISAKTDVDCKGNSTGAATVNVTGGTGGPYDYSWERDGTSVGGNSPSISNVIAGTYSVTVTDLSVPKTAETSVQINGPANELASTIAGTDLRCFRDNSGIANLSVTGGTLPYGYSWSDGTSREDLVLVSASDYFVTVTDGHGCQEIGNVSIEEPTALDISITTDQPVLCYGDMNGILTANATGGTGIKTYVWDDPGHQTAKTATNLEGGLYTVTATDLNLCIVSDNVFLNEPSEMTLSETSHDITCHGEGDGSVILSLGGGTPVYTFVWSNNRFTQNITDLEAGNYSVTVTDQHNCTKMLSNITITEPEGTTLISEEVMGESCYGANDGVITVEASSPAGGITYSIDGSTFHNNGFFPGLSRGNYNVTVRDGNGCEVLLTSATISGPEPIKLDTTVTHSIGDRGGSLIAVASGGIEPYTYSLFSLSSETTSSTGEFDDLLPDEYELFAEDSNPCSSDTLIVLIMELSNKLVIYDAFSPNNDGINDVWNIENIDLYPACKVVIFNTWGNQLFSSDGYTEPWDGKYNGRDLPSGTYYYTIDPGDGSEVLSGPVSIVR
ncbi:MAG: gliding motility-associated C-terminal domain-containing protein [Bacteroidales bacterium]